MLNCGLHFDLYKIKYFLEVFLLGFVPLLMKIVKLHDIALTVD